jgi:nitrogen fixation/metabolism regulation signal transduction histidine kinase
LTAACLSPVRDRQQRLLHGYLHKTSNSLCGIKGYASLIAAGCDPDIKTVLWARRILAEVEHLERVYRSVEDMAFPQRQQLACGDLAPVVREVVQQAQHLHPHLRVEMRCQLNGHLLLPAHDLQLALKELLTNSAEALSADAECLQVRIRLETLPCSGGRIALALGDDGCGLSPELLAEAAHPFVTTKPGHLGIGLARVDTIMDMYGLGWSIQSQEGQWTSVLLEVAVTDVPAGDPEAPPEEG